ncbi:ATPase Cu transporting protein 7B, partial [Coemansia brasiliensis]
MSIRQRWKVDGMTCQSCVRSIENVLQDTTGVEAVKVSLADNQATVTFAPNTVAEETITEAIKDCGFDATADTTSLRHIARLGVYGMTCQSCVRSIEGVLTGMPGIESVQVSLEKEQAEVEWDPAQIDIGVIVEAIDNCG